MKLNAQFPIVSEGGIMSPHFRDYMNELARSLPILGDGSPEGSVEGILNQLYIDRTGSSGSIEYRKLSREIGGDTTKGWVAV